MLEQDGDSSEDGAAKAVHRLLALDEPPTAIVSGNNSMTIGSMRALCDAGLAVPGGIALAFFDDFEWPISSASASPPSPNPP